MLYFVILVDWSKRIFNELYSFWGPQNPRETTYICCRNLDMQISRCKPPLPINSNKIAIFGQNVLWSKRDKKLPRDFLTKFWRKPSQVHSDKHLGVSSRFPKTWSYFVNNKWNVYNDFKIETSTTVSFFETSIRRFIRFKKWNVQKLQHRFLSQFLMLIRMVTSILSHSAALWWYSRHGHYWT